MVHVITQLMGCVRGFHNIFENKFLNGIILMLHAEYEVRATEHSSLIVFFQVLK